MCVIDCVLLELDWAEPIIQFLLHVTCSCISHAYVLHFSIYLLYLNNFGAFLIVSFFPLSILFTLVVSMAPKHKSTPAQNPLHSSASSSSDSTPLSLSLSLSLSLFDSIMMIPTRHSQRTFLDTAFILNAKSFWRTSPTPTFPLSFTVRGGSYCVTSRSHVLSCLSRNFTPTCTGLIVQYLFSLLAFEVRAFLSHRNLLWMCFEFLG